MEIWTQANSTSSHLPPGQAGEAATHADNPGRRPLFQRIGWRRASSGERRLVFIQGAVILAAVLVIGTLVLMALR